MPSAATVLLCPQASALPQALRVPRSPPAAATMRMFAQKHTARALAEEAQVPVLPGSDLLQSEEDAVARAKQIGLPVLLKATGGPGWARTHWEPDTSSRLGGGALPPHQTQLPCQLAATRRVQLHADAVSIFF